MSKNKLKFYKLAVEIAASKELTHSEKLIAAYLFTLFGNGQTFYGSNAYLSAKIDVQKSVISPCLTKLEQMGWITIANRKGNKRSIRMNNNPSVSSGFYRLYTGIAASKNLTSLEKVLLSYILSFTDNGKRFYAKNAMVEHILDISKEGFNTSRIKFEQMNWIKVKYPKTPRRELVVINHPTIDMPSEIPAEVTEEMPLDYLENNHELPKSNNKLPINNNNYISNNISEKKKEIKEEKIEDEITNTDFSISSFSSSSSLKTDTSTKGASPEACLLPSNNQSKGKATSTKLEAPASTSIDNKYTLTEKEKDKTSTQATQSVSASNTFDEVASSSFSGGTKVMSMAEFVKSALEEDEAPFDIRKYLNVSEYFKFRGHLIGLSAKYDSIGQWTIEEADELVKYFTKEQVDELLLDLNIDKRHS
jgi:hypothetical protein